MQRWITILLGALAAPALGQEAPPNFVDHVSPILRENCLSCHKGSRARNGLDLRSVRDILKGGSSGPAIVPGDAEGSLVYQVMAHTAEPFMPPDEDALPDPTLAVIAAWIDGGARVDANDDGSGGQEEDAGPVFVAPPPAGAVVLPEGVPTQPVYSTERSDTINALAASPVAPLVAIGGHRQVSLYRVPEGDLLGVLPFPEGEVRSLRFAASGALLVAAGGRGADLGLAVAWDVKSGERVFALGDEPDLALDADVTVDHGVVAMGGPDRVVRAYSTRTGESLYELTAHTDWVTAVAFSPDGVLLATGDRAGGVFVWEALTGREFHTLPAQRGPVTDIDWRADSMVVAISGDDGRTRMFEMERGKRLEEFRNHDGVQAIQMLRDGNGISAGRDGTMRLWNPKGRKIEDFKIESDVATAACATFDDQHLVVGGLGGEVLVFHREENKEPVARLRANPTTDEERAIAPAKDRLAATKDIKQKAKDELKELRAQYAAAQEEFAEASRAAEPITSQVAPIRERHEAALAARDAAEAAHLIYRDPLFQKDTVAGEKDMEAGKLEAKLAEARSQVDQALDRAVRAEEATLLAVDDEARASLREARELAAELLAGRTAQAQIAAGHAAQARVAAELARAEADAWRARSEPSRLAWEQARSVREEAYAELERANEAARAAERVAFDAAMKRNGIEESITAKEAELEQRRLEMDEARRALLEAEQAWEQMATLLNESRGKVPTSEPAGQ